VIGPTLGGIFAQLDLWRGIFFINVPLCLVAGWMLVRSFHETIEKRPHKIDFVGATLLAVSMTLLILAVLQGGVSWAWNSWQSIGSFAVGGVLLAAFVFAETRASEPILPLWLFSRRLLVTTMFVGLGVGAILIGLTSYVPTYLEGSLDVPPLAAGLALAALTIGWPISAALSGRIYLRIGFRRTAIIGISLALVGTLVLALTAATPSVAVVAIACFVIGLGMGLIATPTLIAAQSSVEWNERGVVTGTNQFARAIGSAIGVAIFGAIANAIFGAGDASSLPPSTIAAGGGAVFIAVSVVAVVTVVAAVAMPATPVVRPDGGADGAVGAVG
jgi:MFS family permease